MKRTALWLVGLACLTAPGSAQDDARPSPDPKVRLKELQAEQRQLMQDWQTKRQQASKAAAAAKAEGKPIPAVPMRPDMSSLRARYLAAAKEFTGEDAVSFLLPALHMGETPDAYRVVLDALFTDHLDSPQLRPLGPMLGHLDEMVDAEFAARTRERIAKQAKDPVLLGWLVLADHEQTLRSNPPASEPFQEAKAELLAAVEKASDEQLAKTSATLLAELEKFGIGMVAPDIVGVDLDGVAFKLSDYKGKVVFLDFWGDW